MTTGDVIPFPGSRSVLTNGSEYTGVGPTMVDLEKVRLNITAGGKLYITLPVKRGTAEENAWADQVRRMDKLLTAARIPHDMYSHSHVVREQGRVPDTIVLDLTNFQPKPVRA